MALEQTYPKKLGNFLKHEYAPEIGYCRDVGVLGSGVTVPTADEFGAGGSFLGTIVYRAVANTGDWVDMPDSVADGSQVGIIVERNDEVTPGEEVVTIVRGPSEIRIGGCRWEGTLSAEDVGAVLKSQGIEVATRYSVPEQVTPAS